MAARLGNYAVSALRDGHSDKCVAIEDGKLYTLPLGVAIQPKQIEIEADYRLIKVLT
jgi:hypothetical protein